MNPDRELEQWANEYEHIHQDDIYLTEEDECIISPTE